MEQSVIEYLTKLKTPSSSFNDFNWSSWNHYFWTIFNSCSSYLEERLIIFATGLISYFLTCFIAYYLIMFYLKSNKSYVHHIHNCDRVLLVTAHPDDECMFFGPVILELIKKSCTVYLLCLSAVKRMYQCLDPSLHGVPLEDKIMKRVKTEILINDLSAHWVISGNNTDLVRNYGGKGLVRKDELWKSCLILGIPESNIFLCRYSQLPDDPKKRWKKSILSPIILSHVEMFQCDTVITFDQSGISGHVNHRAIFLSMCDIIDSNKLPHNCKVYFLETVNILRKYSSFADIFLSFIFSSCWYSLNFKESHQLKKAMKAHESQYVWFRKLYMLFSRYVYINSLRASDSLDLCFDFDE